MVFSDINKYSIMQIKTKLAKNSRDLRFSTFPKTRDFVVVVKS